MKVRALQIVIIVLGVSLALIGSVNNAVACVSDGFDYPGIPGT